jgi:hypothetical protein
MDEHKLSGYVLPLTLEEQAVLLLWNEIQPYMRVDTYVQVQTAIHSVIHNLADKVREEEPDQPPTNP